MEIISFSEDRLADCVAIWNGVVEEGAAFPQEEPLDLAGGLAFFREQSRTGVAAEGTETAGLYILHPNNVGRCGHISNASFAVSPSRRGEGIGELLVRDCLVTARRLGFRILQFNAVVADNRPALGLYEKLGFTRLGTIPGGFRLKSGEYRDIIPHYIEL